MSAQYFKNSSSSPNLWKISPNLQKVAQNYPKVKKSGHTEREGSEFDSLHVWNRTIKEKNLLE